MPREAVRALPLGPAEGGVREFPEWTPGEPTGVRWCNEAYDAWPALGVTVVYDGEKRCAAIEVVLAESEGVALHLSGQEVNYLATVRARELLAPFGQVVDLNGAGVAVPSAGIQALCWEPQDPCIYSLVIHPPRG
jgi:hypothetical protein